MSNTQSRAPQTPPSEAAPVARRRAHPRRRGPFVTFRLALATLSAALLASASLAIVSAPPAAAVGCPNETIRAEQGKAGLALPDCRAYELASPGSNPFLDTNGQPEGARASTLGGAIAYFTRYPAEGATKSGYRYLATRGASGWSVEELAPQDSPQGSDLFNCGQAFYPSPELQQGHPQRELELRRRRGGGSLLLPKPKNCSRRGRPAATATSSFATPPRAPTSSSTSLPNPPRPPTPTSRTPHQTSPTSSSPRTPGSPPKPPPGSTSSSGPPVPSTSSASCPTAAPCPPTSPTAARVATRPAASNSALPPSPTRSRPTANASSSTPRATSTCARRHPARQRRRRTRTRQVRLHRTRQGMHRSGRRRPGRIGH